MPVCYEKLIRRSRLGALVLVLGTFSCRQVTTPGKFKVSLAETARHQLLVKPLGALNGGIPVDHRAFWKDLTVEHLIFTLPYVPLRHRF